MAFSLMQYKPKGVKGIPAAGGNRTIGLYGPPAPKAPKVGAYNPGTGTIGTYGPPAPNWSGPMVPVQPDPKPPKTAGSYSFSIDDDPFVKAARDAMPGAVGGAQKNARDSIIARLLQYGDPGLSSVLDQGAAKQMLANLNLGGSLGSEALNLLGLDKDTQDQITRAYGAEQDEGVSRDVGPSGISTKAQFDRAMAQGWRQRLGNLTGRGAVRSGDLGYQTREQSLTRDVGIQGLVQGLLGSIGQDVSGVDAARQQAQKAIDDAINNARTAIMQNPEQYAAMMGLSSAAPAPVVKPASTAPTSNPLEGALTPAQFGLLQSVFGGYR
jgi:hypothetical protein